MFKKFLSDSSLILEIQAGAIESNTDVAALLRKAKVASAKLDQEDTTRWIDAELTGYSGAFDDLPKYRKIHGILKARNPYHGLIPLFIQDTKTNDLLTRAPIFQGIGSLQKLLDASPSDRPITYPLPQPQRDVIMSVMDIKLEPVLLISRGQIEEILSKVVSMVLDWSLELEKAGVTGEGMSFTKEEKEKARPINQTIIAQNIGHLGDATQNSSVSVQQEVHGDQNIDQRQLEAFLDQAKNAVPLLPEHLRDEVEILLNELSNSPDPKRSEGKLKSLQNVLEGATGNVAAQGIIQLISSLL